MIKFDKKHSGVFAAGVLFGTAGIKLLSSKDAKKVYTNCFLCLFEDTAEEESFKETEETAAEEE